PLVADAHLEGQTLAVIANARGLLHVSHQPEPPARDLARWAPLPGVGPLLEWRQLSAPHVIALADRQGADLVAVRRDAHPVERTAGGADDPLSKSKPGGWSQPRYQQRAENTWEHNADDVAKELTRMVE